MIRLAGKGKNKLLLKLLIGSLILLGIGVGVLYYQNQNKEKSSEPFVFSQPLPLDQTSEPQQQTGPQLTDKPLPTPTPLAKQHLITTPFVPQAPEKNWDQPWQDACEEAALLIPHYYYQQIDPTVEQIRDDILEMIEFENNQGMQKDVDISEMATIASRHLGYQTQIIEDPTIDQIKSYLLRNIPVVIPANGKTLYRENKHFKDGGPYYHNLVILGFDEGKKEFIVHDVGTQFGKNFRYTYNTLMESIHDFPESRQKEDIDQGAKRVLVITSKNQ